ncbi:hypothetical protein B566_EDAN018431 [Ephemera danica]|nr:hypothetical protein B566_EDAN018431 [Ephemera danica]
MPLSLRRAILKTHHDHILSGHLGIRKCLHKIKQHYTWPNMRKDVQDYIRGCNICLQIKPNNHKPYGKRNSYQAKRPGQSISLDLIGCLPRSISGYEYALIITDDFTRDFEIFPLRSANAKSVTEKLIEYCSRNGFPGNIRSENWPQFASKIWNDACKLLGIKTRKTTTYRPAGNPTERTIRTIKQFIKSHVENHRDWAKYLPALSFAIRTSPNETTGYTPAMLHYGRELASPCRGLCARITSKAMTSLQLGQRKIETAREHQRKVYDRTRSKSPFKEGDIVLKSTHILSSANKGIAASLCPKFELSF